MMRLPFFLPCLLLLVSSCRPDFSTSPTFPSLACDSPTTTVSCKVVDFETGLPISNANVVITQEKFLCPYSWCIEAIVETTTDSTGSFSHTIENQEYMNYVLYVTPDSSKYGHRGRYDLREGCDDSYTLRAKTYSQMDLTIKNETGRDLDYLSIAILPATIPYLGASYQFFQFINHQDSVFNNESVQYRTRSLPNELITVHVNYRTAGGGSPSITTFTTNEQDIFSKTVIIR